MSEAIDVDFRDLMRITEAQRKAWEDRTKDGAFNKWLNPQVRNDDGSLNLVKLYEVAKRYGITKNYLHLNPGQQRMAIGNALRARVDPSEYGHCLDEDAVCEWIDEMKANFSYIETDGDCAKLLGIDKTTLAQAKQNGFSGKPAMRTALAMSALLHRLDPYECRSGRVYLEVD